MKRYYSVDIQKMHELGLKFNEWIFLEDIHFRQNVCSDYVDDSKQSLADDHKVHRETLYSLIDKLIDRKLLSRNKKGAIRTTKMYAKVMSKDSTSVSNDMSKVTGKDVESDWKSYYSEYEERDVDSTCVSSMVQKVVCDDAGDDIEKMFEDTWKFYRNALNGNRSNTDSKKKCRQKYKKALSALAKIYPNASTTELADAIDDFIESTWAKDSKSGQLYIPRLEPQLEVDNIQDFIEEELVNG